jgi:putative transposase
VPAIRRGRDLCGKREVLGVRVAGDRELDVLAGGPQRPQPRGVEDVLICCVDGLGGFPGGQSKRRSQAWVQTFIVHLIRSTLRYVNHHDRKKVAPAPRPIYRPTPTSAHRA